MKSAIIAALFFAAYLPAAAIAQNQQERKFSDFCNDDATLSGYNQKMLSVCESSDTDRKAFSNEFSQSSVACKQEIGTKRYDSLYKQGVSMFDEGVKNHGEQQFCATALQTFRKDFVSDKPQNDDRLTPADGVAPSYCENMLAIHGTLSVAQTECGFSKYSRKLIQITQTCHAQLGDERAAEIIKFGMREFNRNEKERGKAALCSALLKSFPSFIAK